MRLRILCLPLILLLQSACGLSPLDHGAPAGRGPLPACAAVSPPREAFPPTASLRQSLILLAVQEWAWFGGQEVDYRGERPIVTRPGIREDGTAPASYHPEAPRRVAGYWRATGFAARSGADGIAWSAAFISWLFVNAGIDASEFCPEQAHALYVERLVERARRAPARLVPRPAAERTPMPGDLICAARAGSGLALDNLNRGAGHCDLVVETRDREFLAIGGNVADSVSRSVFPLDSHRRPMSLSARPFFTVIENRLP